MQYQHIDFGFTEIEGRDRSEDFELVFPFIIPDESILDIGCNIGYYSIRAALEGAGKVVGIDNHKPFIDTANMLKNELSLKNVTFLDIPFENYPIESFDNVICLNVMHHLDSIEQVNSWLDKINQMFIERVVFEVLHTDKDIEIVKNTKNRPKIHISSKYLIDRIDHEGVHLHKSRVTKGRDIVILYK